MCTMAVKGISTEKFCFVCMFHLFIPDACLRYELLPLLSVTTEGIPCRFTLQDSEGIAFFSRFTSSSFVLQFIGEKGKTQSTKRLPTLVNKNET